MVKSFEGLGRNTSIRKYEQHKSLLETEILEIFDNSFDILKQSWKLLRKLSKVLLNLGNRYDKIITKEKSKEIPFHQHVTLWRRLYLYNFILISNEQFSKTKFLNLQKKLEIAKE